MIPRKTLTITRYSAGTRVKGTWVEGTPSTFEADYSVQPLTGREMQLLPEDRRTTQSYRLYGDTKLYTVDVNTGTNADRVTIDGETYEVFSCAPWQNTIINHYKIIVIKVGG